MHELRIYIMVPWILVSFSPQHANSRVDEKMRRVENGLVEMTSPSIAVQLQAGRGKFDHKSSLAERMAHYGVPGVSVAVIDDYEVEWTRGYGVIRARSDRPVTPGTCFEAASTSKLLASAITLRLCEDGELDLDGNVNDRLTSWKVPENSFTRREKVTLRRLLTHQSGLNRPDGGFREREGTVPTLLHILRGEAPAENDAAVVEFVPGTRHQYSNLGYLVIQSVLEDVTGRTYPQLARETVFDPLRMTKSTLLHPLQGRFKEDAAFPHDDQGNAHDRPQSPTALAHGGLVTTPADLARFAIELMQAYQGRSRRIVSQEFARQMFRPIRGLDPGQYFGMTQGLGVFLIGTGENRYFCHPGHNDPGATCIVVASPTTGKGAVIMTNGAAGIQLSLEILAAIASEYGWPTADS